ncbi:MAG: MFS transporter [Dehalococcoidia bacterium]
MARYASSPGQTHTFAVFLEPIKSDLEITDTTISSLYLASSLVAAFMVIVIGRLYDKVGVRVLLPVSGLLIGLAALWMSQVSSEADLFIAFAALRTLGQGALGMITATMVSVWFIRRRATALAVMMLGSALASGTFPSLASSLSGWLGWREAWVVFAFIPWVLVIAPAILLVRRSPEAMGLVPDGAGRGGISRRAAPVERSFTLRGAMGERSMWLLMFAGAAQSAISTSLMFHQVSLLGDRGLSPGAAAAMFGVTAPMMLVGQFTSGFLADRYPIRMVIAGGQVLLFASIATIAVVGNVWQATAYAVLLGFSLGLLLNSLLSIWPSYFGRAHLGSIRGVGQWSTMVAAAIGPLPLAISRDVTGSFGAGLLVLAVLPILCGLAALAATRPKDGAEG